MHLKIKRDTRSLDLLRSGVNVAEIAIPFRSRCDGERPGTPLEESVDAQRVSS